MEKHSVTVRMGAAHWDALIEPSSGDPIYFNFREMSRDERRKFHATFMASYRQTHPMYADHKPKRKHKRRRHRNRRPHQSQATSTGRSAPFTKTAHSHPSATDH